MISLVGGGGILVGLIIFIVFEGLIIESLLVDFFFFGLGEGDIVVFKLWVILVDFFVVNIV